jgi:SAM-dependent methyltransferase
MKMPDWTIFSDDPNDAIAKAAVSAWLPSARRIHDDTDVLGFILPRVAGKKVLDIGIVEHSANYIDRPNWRHGRIAAVAAHCLGIDILEPLLDELRHRGFNTRCVDATSDIDMGERYEAIFIGDVIEHVNNPTALLSFAERHLASEGRLYVTTPNPFSRKFLRQFHRQHGSLVGNLDHVAWITPTQAMELARRAGLNMVAYHLVKKFTPMSRKLKALAWRFQAPEYSFPDYIYEFSRRD